MQLVATQSELPDSVESEKNGGGIAGSSGQPRFGRNPLEEFDMNALVDTRLFPQQLRGLHCQIVLPVGNLIRCRSTVSGNLSRNTTRVVTT